MPFLGAGGNTKLTAILRSIDMVNSIGRDFGITPVGNHAADMRLWFCYIDRTIRNFNKLLSSTPLWL